MFCNRRKKEESRKSSMGQMDHEHNRGLQQTSMGQMDHEHNRGLQQSSMKRMDHEYNQGLQQTSMGQMDHEHNRGLQQSSMGQMNHEHNQGLQQTRMTEEEQKYRSEIKLLKSQLEAVNQELRKCKEKYADFRERMISQVSSELKQSGSNCENIMDPCRESVLLDMYEKMKVQIWRSTKEKLLLHGVNKQSVYKCAAELIKMMFKQAKQYVERKIEGTIYQVCRIPPETDSKRVSDSLCKIKHEFQLLFYNSDADYNGIAKDIVSQYSLEHTEIWTDLAAECFKLAILMALHDPPLLPVWDKTQTDRQLVLFPAIQNGSYIICQEESWKISHAS